VLELLDAVARKATLAAMNCVELVPGRDADGLSALTAARIVAYAMALAARQRAS
jgi:arginase family enzyme